MLRPTRILDPDLEQQSPPAREAYLSRRLRETVPRAAAASAHLRQRLADAGLSPEDVHGPADLGRLPVLRKDALPALQAERPPFGDLLGVPPGRLARIFMSPGPIYDPQGEGEDFWRFRHGLAAAGFRAGELAHNAASYHLTPLGFMLDAAARALGCAVIPAGVGQTELQVKVAAHLGATAYLGTPSFLHVLLTKARELGAPLRFEAAFVVAEMLPESLRAELERDFGLRVLQGYGTADLGCLAYECPEKGGWHLHPECLVEVLDLEGGQPAAPGQPGEVVASVFDEAYPLLRFGTGDIGALAPAAPCPCGRTAPKLAGLIGRIGDAVKVKGMFVRGGELAAVLAKFPEVKRFQAVVTREHHQDHLEYAVELASPASADDALAARLADALREAVKVRGEVRFVAAGTLAEGAKRVDDRRVWK
ncbi:MAG TPA: AMP-binding protein [Anaeromyxobacteraceae bacterium]|nr:AMP-binding protein [Anaeromyxobacteraceae bacterium]